MDKKYRHLLRATLAALPLACVAMMSSCSYDDYGECPDSDTPATVRVSVSAGEPGDLNGTRAGDDVNADEQEFMHTLRLYIVNDNVKGVRRTVLDLSPDLTNNTLAQTGDLTNYETGEFTLAPGTYTIYAFANVDGYDGEFGTDNGQRAVTQMTMTEFLDDCFAIDQQVRDGDLAEYRIYNPAENLDFANGMYIPMSAKKTITVTPNTSDISIGLDRLVSKVRITVPDNQYISTSSTIQFSDYAENVPLLGADSGYGSAELYGGRTATTEEMPFTQAGQEVSFYVNETYTGDPFTVTLSTGKSGNGDVSAYVAKTQRTDIPRNSIYPLSLTFPDFTPQFEWQSWEAAIGSVPVEVVVEENNYIVKIASGNTFKFTVNGVNGTNSQLQSATWAFASDVTNQITDIQIGNNAIGGAISAGVPAGTQIPLTVTVNWRADYTDATGSTERRNFTRTYNVTIKTIDIWDTEYKSYTRGSWRTYRLTPEVLNMFIKR